MLEARVLQLIQSLFFAFPGEQDGQIPHGLVFVYLLHHVKVGNCGDRFLNLVCREGLRQHAHDRSHGLGGGLVQGYVIGLPGLEHQIVDIYAVDLVPFCSQVLVQADQLGDQILGLDLPAGDRRRLLAGDDPAGLEERTFQTAVLIDDVQGLSGTADLGLQVGDLLLIAVLDDVFGPDFVRQFLCLIGKLYRFQIHKLGDKVAFGLFQADDGDLLHFNYCHRDPRSFPR